MSTLYICEKPSQARDIARHLKATTKQNGYLEGNGYQVTWCVGHLLELAPPELYKSDIKPWGIEKLPIVPDRWQMIVSSKTSKQFDVIKKSLAQTNHVVIATDADREGEMIAREILETCSYKGKIERLWLSALDDASIQKALKTIKPGKETEKLYAAGVGRQRADWLVGMNMTMAASSLYGVNSVLSVGRVQTPTLKLVVDRDRAIEQFKPQDYFVLKVLFETDKKEQVWTTWQASEQVINDEGHCLDKALIESIAAKVEEEPGQVVSFKEVTKRQKAPLCFSLSDLQKKASSLFGFSAKHTLELAQALYETHKAVTYPRTDCGYLPEEQFADVPKVIDAIAQADHQLKPLIDLCNAQFKSAVWNDKKITAHHAIIPTLNTNIDIGKMSDDEFKIYDVIRRHYLAQFLGDYEYLQRTVEMSCAGERFTAIGYTPVKLGWRQAFQSLVDEEEEQPENKIIIPHLIKGQAVINRETHIENKQTKPPARFSEGTLIEAMKTVGKFINDEALKKVLKDSSGIGTEATRANILEILFKRAYLKRHAKQVISTEKGRALIDLVPEVVKNPLLTAQWEQQLDRIAEDKCELNDFVEAQAKLLGEMLVQLQGENEQKKQAVLQLRSDTKNGKVYLCPKCESPLRRLKNKKGNYFYGCSGFPSCAFTTWEKNGKPSL